MFKLTRDEQIAIAVGLLIASVIAIMTFSGWTRNTSYGTRADIAFSNTDARKSSNESESRTPRTILVHISGQVLKPKVYRLKWGARLYELIDMAGPTMNADLDGLNLASTLQDGQKVVVLTKGGHRKSGSYSTVSRDMSGVININTAYREQLEALPGIGPVYAGRIIEYREKYGFRKIEDIIKVKGIAQRTLERIKDLICVE